MENKLVVVEGGFVFDRLPTDLIERIFAYLPVVSVFKCRCVCKRWNALLTSDSFVEVWAQFSPKQPWFILYHSNSTIISYSPSSNRWKWNNLLLSDQCSLHYKHFRLIASSGGLLCFQDLWSFTPFSPTYLIYNPVTGSHRVLPNLLHILNPYIVGMVTDKVTGFYKIMITGTSDEIESITEVFDSRTGNWEHQCRSQNKLLVSSDEVVNAIWHEGLFYILCRPHDFLTEEGYHLVAYDMEKMEWIDFNVKEPSSNIECPSLLIYDGKLHMSGLVAERDSISSFHILTLSMETLQWVKTEESEDEFLKEISYFQPLFFQFHGHGVLLYGLGGWQRVMYNLSKRTWYHLPEFDDSDPYRVTEGNYTLIGLVYEPSLSAKV